jgi:uncharacterized membrane protein
MEYIRPVIQLDIPFLDLIIVLLLIALVGFLGQTLIFRPVKTLVNRTFEKLPIIKYIYTSLKDIISAFVGKDKKFNHPVLVKVNHISNLEKLGFITSRDLSMIGIKEKKVAIYFPHSYNFSGEMFIVPSDQVTPVDIPAAEVMKFIVSAGIIQIENK